MFLRAMAALVLLLAHVQNVWSAELEWTGRPFQILADEKPLADLLKELAASQGTTAVVDSKVTGTISGRFNGEPMKTLESLCSTYGLSWYFDGAFLYIDPSADARSEVFSTNNADGLMQSLAQLRILDARFPILSGGRDGSVRVTGPKRYVDMVRQVAKLLDGRSTVKDPSEVRLFQLKYAWADDYHVTRSGKDLVVPGVAGTLKRLFARSAPAASSSSSANPRPMAGFQIGADRQLKLSTGDVVSAPRIHMPALAPSSEQDSQTPQVAVSSDAPGYPQFEADARLNAVLVRDEPARMAQYERLIASMDIRPRLVEIELTIMDVSNDTLESLGVDWRAHTGHGDFQLGNGGNSALTFDSTSEAGQVGGVCCTNGQGVAVTPVGGVFTASIGNTLRNYLLARVNALAQKGDADLIARPKVLTLDNFQASLENLSDFYVRVSGYQDASLFKVTTGTSVRVTPLIVDEQSGRGVMMTIDIEDGGLDGQNAVDQIPVVLRRSVNTQALIGEGSSLLLAGFSSESKSKATTGVPFLSDVPVLGRLFKYEQKKLTKRERLYLLTPRLVTITNVAGDPGLTSLPTQEAPRSLIPPEGRRQ
ncbi:type III secretion system outer membrane ring subunit SctC [Roseateles sp. NT4]|uniref:type III secretion system outer membrane ring subunit SctC n=1 Tax=Roseateles sp. NT4 TaxID=3453715 RepID=UPI003EEAB139